MMPKSKYGNEILDRAYEKYFKHQKITYEEYVIMLATNDEIWFWYHDAEYQVDHGLPDCTCMYITKYEDDQKVSERYEKFTSIIDMLQNFRVEGKAIKDIWYDVEF